MKEFLKSHTKPFLQSVAFFLIFILLFLYVQNFFNLKGSGYTKSMYFSEEEDNSINVMYFGNSRCDRSINPTIVDEIAGTYSFNMGIQGLRSSHVFVRMKNAFKTQKPKLLAIEIAIFTPSATTTLEESYGHRTLMPLPTNFTKALDAIELAKLAEGGIKTKADRAVEYFLPLLRFHSRYPELSAGDFVYDLINMGDYDYDEAGADKCIKENRGYTVYAKHKTLKQTTKTNYFEKDFSAITNEAELDGATYECLQEIIAYARENGCQILFFSVPALGEDKNADTTEPIMNYLQACYGNDEDIKFVDLYDHIKEIGLDYKYYQNKGHVNEEGSAMVSEFIGNFIKDNYDASMWN